MYTALCLAALATTTLGREIVFPPVSGYQSPLGDVAADGMNDMNLFEPQFAGLTTFANLPYVHCLAQEGTEIEKFDIGILGAPFDTVSLPTLQL